MSAFELIGDDLILAKSIPFVRKPAYHMVNLDRKFQASGVINYSRLYASLPAEQKALFIPPEQLLTGDVYQFHDYRACNSNYVVWLHADAFMHRAKDAKVDLAPDRWQPDAEEEAKEKMINSFGLSNKELCTVRDILNETASSFDQRIASLMPILADRAPEWLVELSEGGWDTSMRMMNRMYFHEDERSEGDQDDEGEDKHCDQLDQEGNGMECNDVCKDVTTTPSLPRIVDREALSAIAALPWMNCYLFPHTDEYGRSAPSAVSMAPMDYFHLEFDGRIIDTQLLPGVMGDETSFGPVLKTFLSQLPACKQNKDRYRFSECIAHFDSSGEDTLFLDDIKSAVNTHGQLYGRSSQFVKTREVFASHLQCMRKQLATAATATGNADGAALLASLTPLFA